jgi:AraC-like DNA-binding protein
MNKETIKAFIERKAVAEGMNETGLSGVKVFRVTEPIQCAPVVYEPSITVILSGTKEAILDGDRHIYGPSHYLCCTMSMPVEAGTPITSPEDPLLGIYIPIDSRVMTELAIEMETANGALRKLKGEGLPQSIALAEWDDAFTEALFRLLHVVDNPMDAAVLGEARLRELYNAVLKGQAGDAARKAFGVGNQITRTIEYLSSHLNETVTIDDMAARVGMSRAVLHRKFKQATTLSPMQFVKSMRLNNAAMKISGGMTVNQAALDVGYTSSSQFSREFKRVYGQSPKQWSSANQIPREMM